MELNEIEMDLNEIHRRIQNLSHNDDFKCPMKEIIASKILSWCNEEMDKQSNLRKEN
tara:strand:+ start:16 stop:186 length:171 start_codon:yes stop_codon:yes gene_type:complete